MGGDGAGIDCRRMGRLEDAGVTNDWVASW